MTNGSLRKFFYTFIIVVVFFTGLEVSARIVTLYFVSTITIPDGRLGHQLLPNYNDGEGLTINSKGYR